MRIGTDGHALLAAVAGHDAPSSLREVDAVERLRQILAQQYDVDGAGQVHGRTRELHGVPIRELAPPS